MYAAPKFGFMTAIRRLPRGTRRDTKRLGWAIEAEEKDFLDAVAINAGVSSAVLLEHMIEHMRSQMTDQGIPAWWPHELPRDNELELPISA